MGINTKDSNFEEPQMKTMTKDSKFEAPTKDSNFEAPQMKTTTKTQITPTNQTIKTKFQELIQKAAAAKTTG